MIKYLFKYVSKGVERVRFAVPKNEVDREANPSAGIQPLNEVHNFVDGRYIFLHEATWRILNFYIHQRHPPVLLLPVHLHNMQHIVFKENSKLEDVLCQAGFARTPLLGWFDNNARDPTGHELTYLDYPKDYKWDGDSKQWGRRVFESSKIIGRFVFVHPTFDELFYLQILLCHQKECKSYEDVRTVFCCLHPNFRSACNALRLIGDDVEWMTVFIEASTWATS